MSFIDMMANDVWSEADIVKRTESIIHNQFPPQEEFILNRKATGIALGKYQPSPDEMAELVRYTQIAEAARLEGEAARADMALLRQVMAVETAQRLLKEQADETAQALVDSASEEVMHWVNLRNPVAELPTTELGVSE